MPAGGDRSGHPPGEARGGLDGSQPVGLSADRGFLDALLGLIEGILGSFVSDDGHTVDYPALAASGEFRAYRAKENGLAGFDPFMLGSRDERLAFWINLFNITVISNVIQQDVRGGVDRCRGFFSARALRIGNRGYSLDDMEHGIIRGNLRISRKPLRQLRPWDPRLRLCIRPPDPRSCLALAHGCKSDPALVFYHADALEAELYRAAAGFIQSGAVLDHEAASLALSPIFKLYSRDFGGDQGIMRFLANNMESVEDAAFLRVRAGSIRVRLQEYERGLNGPQPEE